ncbi:AraC family transcriptional regulator [Nocardiopsis changdeensis]|uniref:AraC family transcriptional regulator n=1 Tax=Nocardiopsis changdeensis TaxID=2831969 RepID=UPI003F48662B
MDDTTPEPVGPLAGARGGRLRYGRGAPGIERLAVSFSSGGFAPHRHDVYAVGVTLAGVQGFGYRGGRHHCLPGQAHVLHPDEEHDGAAGTEEGFGYRIVHIDPALVQRALGGVPLPFVADPVVPAERVPRALLRWLGTMDDPLDGLAGAELAASLTDLLLAWSGRSAPARPRGGPLPLAALERARGLIADDPAAAHSAEELERACGLDRWTVARRFREAFGTSPTRFRAMRRLDRARRLIASGVPLAAAAVEAGFADQSHLTRVFKGAYGLTPGRWAAALERAPAPERGRGRPPAAPR